MDASEKIPPMNKLVKTQKILGWVILMAGIGVVYAFIYLIFPPFISGTLKFYIAQSLMWIGLAALSYLIWRIIPETKPRLQREFLLLASGLGLAQLAVWVLSGLAFGFGSSLFDHSLFGLLSNTICLVSMLLGMEMTRATLVVVLRHRPAIGILLVSLIMLILQEPYFKFLSLSSGPAIVKLMGSEILPAFLMNILTSLLALIGGPIPAILYRGLLLIFEWGSPILPNLNWAITALIGSLVPVVGMLYIQGNYFSQESTKQAKSGSTLTTTLPWIVVLSVAVIAIWFNMGVFGVRPFIVSGHSMKPVYETGDLLIVQSVKPEEIQVGDIIRFDRENTEIVHRVLQIQDTAAGLVFITKGDNNNVEDPPVPQNIVKGKVVWVVSKIGWVSIGIRQAFAWVH